MTDASPPRGLSAISPDEAVRRVSLAHRAIISEMQKAVVGQEPLIDELLIALFARGHCLLEGMPGAAKSRTVTAFSRVVRLKLSQVLLTRWWGRRSALRLAVNSRRLRA